MVRLINFFFLATWSSECSLLLLCSDWSLESSIAVSSDDIYSAVRTGSTLFLVASSKVVEAFNRVFALLCRLCLLLHSAALASCFPEEIRFRRFLRVLKYVRAAHLIRETSINSPWTTACTFWIKALLISLLFGWSKQTVKSHWLSSICEYASLTVALKSHGIRFFDVFPFQYKCCSLPLLAAQQFVVKSFAD